MQDVCFPHASNTSQSISTRIQFLSSQWPQSPCFISFLPLLTPKGQQILQHRSVLVRFRSTEFVATLLFIHNQMSDRQSRKDLSKELAFYKPSHYSRALAMYQRHKLGKVDPILRAIALPCPLTARLPVYKTLRATAKLLLLNEIQLIIMAVIIQQSRWKMDDAPIVENELGVGELLCFSCDNNDYRRLTLYLLLTGWAAKSALNEDCEEMLNEVRRVCFNFKSIFQQWLYPYSAVLNLHPAMVNRLYSYYLHPLASTKTDYQLMVDTILQLSQAYNPEKEAAGGQCKREALHSKREEVEERPRVTSLQARFANFQFQRLMKAQQKKEEEEMNVFDNKDLTQSIPFPGVFGSSIGGFFSLGSVNISKQSQFEYYQVQLGSGDNNFVVFSHGDPTLSSVLGIQRATSTTDKFLEKQEDGRSQC